MQLKRKLMAFSLLVLMLCLAVISIGYAAPPRSEIQVPRVEAGIYVYDQGDIIDDGVQQRLNNMLVDLEKKTGVEFAVVTVPNLNGLTNQEYSLELANTLKIGKSAKNNGILLFVSAAEKSDNVFLQIGRGMEGLLNDAKCGRIPDEFFVPHRDKGDLSQAIDKTTQAVVNVVAADNEVVIDGSDQEIQVSDEEGLSAGGLFLIILIVIIVIVLFAIVFANGGFDDDGGYYGGYSGGSSGGGFGGGGFGGGGAGR